MKTSGLNLPDNCTLQFHANGIKVSASLNISPDLLKFMSKGRVYKSNHYFVYYLERDIPLKHCSARNIRMVYEQLINRVMTNIREKKKLVLDEQIKNIKQRQTKIKF